MEEHRFGFLPDFDEEERRRELVELLQELMLTELTEKERKVVADRVYGMTLREIAEADGVSFQSVNLLLISARKKIKLALEI